MKNIKIFSLLTGISLILAVIIFNSNSHTSSNNIHDINYYYYNNNNNNFYSSQKDNLTIDVAIFNNLCAKMGVDHRFRINSIIEIPKDSENFETYFYDQRKNNRGKIKIFLDQNASLIVNPKYYNERRFIHIPFPDIHNNSIVLHEIVHALMHDEKQNIHVAPNNMVGHCILEYKNHCMNLMSRDYFTPFNFLMTEAQIEWINDGKYSNRASATFINSGNSMSPCVRSHFIPEDIPEDIEEEVQCSPRYDKLTATDFDKLTTIPDESDKELIKLIFTYLNNGEAPIINWPTGLNSTTYNSKNYQKVFTAQQFPKDKYTIEDLRRAIQIKTELLEIYYDSKYYLNLLEMESKFLTEGAKDYLVGKDTLIGINKNYVYNVRVKSMKERLKGEEIRSFSKLADRLPELREISSEQLYFIKKKGRKIDCNIIAYDFLPQNGLPFELYVRENETSKINALNEGLVCLDYDQNKFITRIENCEAFTIEKLRAGLKD